MIPELSNSYRWSASAIAGKNAISILAEGELHVSRISVVYLSFYYSLKSRQMIVVDMMRSRAKLEKMTLLNNKNMRVFKELIIV